MIKGCIVLFTLIALCSGFTYVPVTDDNLVKHSHTVIIGTVVEELSQEAFKLNGTYRFYKVQVAKVLSESEPLNEVIIRTLGGPDASSDSYLHVPGSPSFSNGETVLLFIQPSDQFYVIDHFALGAFHQIEYDDGHSKSSYAYRTSDHDSSSSTLRLRDFNTFSDFIQSGHRFERDIASQSYWKDLSMDEWSSLQQHISPVRARYNQMMSNGVPVRWSQFDSAGSITWMSEPAGQPGLNGGGFSEFSQAFAAWASVPGTSINYVFGGTTTVTLGGLSTSDGKEGIIWDTTERNEIAGSFNCQTGGVIAIGGWRTRGERTTFRGITFYKIIEADTVLQDGLACWLSRSSTPSKDFANAITHEFGHTLGFGHSCGDDASGTCVAGSSADTAIMRAFTHAGVGPVLGTDDVLGAQYVYGTCFPNCESLQPTPTPNIPPSSTPTPSTPNGGTISSTVFVVRFDVAFTSFNKRQVNLGFCELLSVSSTDCKDEYFANTNTWEGSTYYQFSLAGPLVSKESTLQNLITNSPDKVSSAVGYTLLVDGTDVSADGGSGSDSESKLIGLSRKTGMYVLIGGGGGLFLLIVVVIITTALVRRRSASSQARRYRRSSSVVEAPPVVPSAPDVSDFSPEVRPPIYSYQIRGDPSVTPSLGVGSFCSARWSGDEQYYNARILHQSGDHYLVSFVDFDDSNKDEWVLKTNVKP